MSELNIEIAEEDLVLDDHTLFMKVYENFQNTNEVVPNMQILSEEITRAINVGKGRKICPICDGFGMSNGLKCLGPNCLGKGYCE